MHINKYERNFIRLGVAMLVVFAGLVALSVFGLGVTLPGAFDQVDPEAVQAATDPLFSRPGVREIYPGRYEVVIVARQYSFQPDNVRVPVGSDVTFLITSADVIHGFKVFDTNLNVMVIPGQVSEVHHTFNEVGFYSFYCHEYCGGSHHIMEGVVEVYDPELEPTPTPALTEEPAEDDADATDAEATPEAEDTTDDSTEGDN